MQTAQHLKTEGQQLALLHAGDSWVEQALDLLRQYCATEGKGSAFRFEQFRAWALYRGLPNPPTHKVWGSIPSIACRRGVIAWTGDYEAAQSIKTHGHPVKTWRGVA